MTNIISVQLGAIQEHSIDIKYQKLYKFPIPSGIHFILSQIPVQQMTLEFSLVAKKEICI